MSSLVTPSQKIERLERIVNLAGLPGFQALREEALEKLGKNEDTIMRLISRTRAPVDPLEIEYFRGFRQGVMYVLDGIPNAAEPEIGRILVKLDKDGDS